MTARDEELKEWEQSLQARETEMKTQQTNIQSK